MNNQEIVRVAATEAELLEFVKGSWQADCISGNQIVMPKLRGKAADYRSKYERSIENLLARLTAAGYGIDPIPGPRGGKPKTWVVYKPCGKVE